MSEQNSVENMLDATAGILIKCFVMGIAALIVWIFIVMGVPNWAWQIHGKFFDLSGEQVVLVQYAGLLMTKAGIFVLFLFPYIAIKLALRKSGSRSLNN